MFLNWWMGAGLYQFELASHHHLSTDLAHVVGAIFHIWSFCCCITPSQLTVFTTYSVTANTKPLPRPPNHSNLQPNACPLSWIGWFISGYLLAKHLNFILPVDGSMATQGWFPSLPCWEEHRGCALYSLLPDLLFKGCQLELSGAWCRGEDLLSLVSNNPWQCESYLCFPLFTPTVPAKTLPHINGNWNMTVIFVFVRTLDHSV